jgi:hypothetical protein
MHLTREFGPLLGHLPPRLIHTFTLVIRDQSNGPLQRCSHPEISENHQHNAWAKCQVSLGGDIQADDRAYFTGVELRLDTLEHDAFKSNRHHALAFCFVTIFSQKPLHAFWHIALASRQDFRSWAKASMAARCGTDRPSSSMSSPRARDLSMTWVSAEDSDQFQ